MSLSSLNKDKIKPPHIKGGLNKYKKLLFYCAENFFLDDQRPNAGLEI